MSHTDLAKGCRLQVADPTLGHASRQGNPDRMFAGYPGQPLCGRPGVIFSALPKYSFFSTSSGRSMP